MKALNGVDRGVLRGLEHPPFAQNTKLIIM